MSKDTVTWFEFEHTEIGPVAASGNNTLTLLANDGTIINGDSNGVGASFNHSWNWSYD